MARVTGTLTNVNDVVTIDLQSASKLTAYLSGASFDLSVAFDGSDGTTWSPLGFSAGQAQTQLSVSSASLSNVQMPRTYHCDRTGVVQARVRCTSVTSGSLDVVLESYAVAAPSAASGGTDVVEALYISG